jgi:hypothetical protein
MKNNINQKSFNSKPMRFTSTKTVNKDIEKLAQNKQSEFREPTGLEMQTGKFRSIPKLPKIDENSSI